MTNTSRTLVTAVVWVAVGVIGLVTTYDRGNRLLQILSWSALAAGGLAFVAWLLDVSARKNG